MTLVATVKDGFASYNNHDIQSVLDMYRLARLCATTSKNRTKKSK
jgi:hypothetical protein